MKTFDETFKLVIDAHQGQTSKDGTPFIYHPIGVAYMAARLFPDEPKLQIIGLMHDIIEDTPTTFAQLHDLGYDDEILSALNGLSRIVFPKKETYKDFIIRGANDINTVKVKICDLMYNINRASTLTSLEEEHGLRKRWQFALLYLKDKLYKYCLNHPSTEIWTRWVFVEEAIDKILIENAGLIFRLEMKINTKGKNETIN